MIVSSIDIGTNTIRLLVAEKLEKCRFNFLVQKSEIARLGEGLSKSGFLSVAAIDRALKILRKYKDISESLKAERIIACATSAVREAKNKDLFLKKAKQIGIEVKIIDPQDEAILTHIGIIYFLKDYVKNKKWVAFDLGGGSTEFMFSVGRQLKSYFSVPTGVVKLLEKFLKQDPPSIYEVNRAEDFFIELLEEFPIDYDIQLVVANAGTVTTLAAIDLELNSYSQERTEGYKLHLSSIEKILGDMLKVDSKDRLKRYHILQKGREDVIVVGASIVKSILEFFKKDYLITTNGSLREGILIKEMCYGK